MQLSPYIETLRGDLAAAAATAAPEVARAGELLAAALEPATRLVLLDAVSEAANEVNAAFRGGAVEVRLRGRDPELVVVHETEAPAEPAPPVDDEGTARVTLRLPETLKSRAEQAAAAEGVSVNTWLVRAAARALDTPTRHGPRRFTGYARG